MTLTASQTLITVLAVALGCMITRFAPFVIFPDSKEPPEVGHLAGQGAARRHDGTAGGLLSQRGFPGQPAPWHPGISGDPGDRPAPPVEAQHFAEHRRRHSGLYAAGTDCILNRKSLRPTASRRDFLFAGECFPGRGFSVQEGSGGSAGAAAPG